MVDFNTIFALPIFILLETKNFESEIDSNFQEFDILYTVCILLLKFVSFLYIAIKFYKLLCYTKMTCDWFPMLNPYHWPVSFFQTVTKPYFRFWSFILPSLKLKKSSIEIYGIIGLEALNALIYFCVRFANFLVDILENIS